MSIKELVVKKVQEIPETEPLLQEILNLIESKKRTFKGRPLLRPEDLKNMDNDLPPEPEWEDQNSW